MAIYCGVIVGGFGGYVADAPDLGWRWAFDACGMVGMLYALPLLLLLRDAPRPADAPRAPRGLAARRAARNCSTNRSFILLVLYFTLPALAGWVVRDWMPAILKQQFDIGQGKAGVSATLYWQVAAIVGAHRRAAGWRTAGCGAHERGRIFVSAIGMSLIVPAMFGVGNAGTLARGGRVPDPVRPRLGLLRLQQHADPLPDRAARAARHRLRHHEPGQHQLRRLRRLGLRRAARPQVPLNVIFGVFAGAAVVSIVLVLLIRPRPDLARSRRRALRLESTLGARPAPRRAPWNAGRSDERT